MIASPTLFDVDQDPAPLWAQDEIGETWWAFHREHPDVWQRLEQLLEEWKRETGGRRCGMKMLWETLRFRTGLGDPSAAWRLSNNYTALYARLVAVRRPDLAEMLQYRERRA